MELVFIACILWRGTRHQSAPAHQGSCLQPEWWQKHQEMGSTRPRSGTPVVSLTPASRRKGTDNGVTKVKRKVAETCRSSFGGADQFGRLSDGVIRAAQKAKLRGESHSGSARSTLVAVVRQHRADRCPDLRGRGDRFGIAGRIQRPFKGAGSGGCSGLAQIRPRARQMRARRESITVRKYRRAGSARGTPDTDRRTAPPQSEPRVCIAFSAITQL